MIKNQYKDDYSFSPRLGNRERVVDDICYVGDYYIFPFDEKQKKKKSMVVMIFVLFLFGIQIAAGLLNQDSSRTSWIVYPYLMIFVPIAYMFMGAATFCRVPVRMQKVQFETGIERCRRSAIGILILSIFSLILDIVYMILHRAGLHWGRELLYAGCHLMLIVLILVFGKYYNKVFAGIRTEASGNKLE